MRDPAGGAGAGGGSEHVSLVQTRLFFMPHLSTQFLLNLQFGLRSSSSVQTRRLIAAHSATASS